MKSEFDFINWICDQRYESENIPVGPGDDCAVVKTPNGDLLAITVDQIVEGVHFDSNTPPEQIGRKALAISFSDIAAMGYKPVWTVAAVNLKPSLPEGYAEKIYEGMRKLADDYSVAIVGGNVTASENELSVSTTVIGMSNGKPPVLRSGAKPGEDLWVTGPIGGSFNTQRHLWFEPRLRESEILVKMFKPTSMIDVSDGFAQDLLHILEDSKIGAEVWGHQIPLNEGVPFEQAINDGEDFELIFTLTSEKSVALKEYLSGGLFGAKPFIFYHFGKTIDLDKGRYILCTDNSKVDIVADGYDHLKDK